MPAKSSSSKTKKSADKKATEKKTATKKPVAKKTVAKKATSRKKVVGSTTTPSSLMGIEPYKEKAGEEYMNENHCEHFTILRKDNGSKDR